MNLHQKTPDPLSRVFLALAHPIRRKILSSLVNGEVSVGELAEIVQRIPKYDNISLVAVTKHMKILEKAGLITKRKDKQLRLSYLQAKPLREAGEWIIGYRQFWDESLDKLEEYIEEQKKKEKQNETTNSK